MNAPYMKAECRYYCHRQRQPGRVRAQSLIHIVGGERSSRPTRSHTLRSCRWLSPGVPFKKRTPVHHVEPSFGFLCLGSPISCAAAAPLAWWERRESLASCEKSEKLLSRTRVAFSNSFPMEKSSPRRGPVKTRLIVTAGILTTAQRVVPVAQFVLVLSLS